MASLPSLSKSNSVPVRQRPWSAHRGIHSTPLQMAHLPSWCVDSTAEKVRPNTKAYKPTKHTFCDYTRSMAANKVQLNCLRFVTPASLPQGVLLSRRNLYTKQKKRPKTDKHQGTLTLPSACPVSNELPTQDLAEKSTIPPRRKATASLIAVTQALLMAKRAQKRVEERHNALIKLGNMLQEKLQANLHTEAVRTKRRNSGIEAYSLHKVITL